MTKKELLTFIIEPYVYLLHNKRTGHWYVGRQGNIKLIIGFNYFTSSKSMHPQAKWFRESFAEHSLELEDWDVDILYQGKDYIAIEHKEIIERGVHCDDECPLSLNWHNGCGEFSSKGRVSVYFNNTKKTGSVSKDEFVYLKEQGELIFAMCSEEAMAKKESTCEHKYGVTNPMQLDVFKQKVQDSKAKACLANPLYYTEIENKKIATNLKNRNVPYPILDVDIQEKISKTNMELYGASNPFGSSIIQEKIQSILLERYNVINPSQMPEVQIKKKINYMKKRGVENPAQDPLVKAKIAATNLGRYGVPNPAQSLEVMQKIRNTNLQRRGVEYVLQDPLVRAKISATNLDRYGVPNPTQSPEVIAKIAQTNSIKYPNGINAMPVVAFLKVDDKILPIKILPSGKFVQREYGIKISNAVVKHPLGKICALRRLIYT